MRAKHRLKDKVAFWAGVSAFLTLCLAWIAWIQLEDINKTSKAEFILHFNEGFFNQRSRDLIMLFEFDLLKFKTKKVTGGKEFAYFELNKEEYKALVDAMDESDKKEIKEKYSSYDIDDDLLGHFDDIGNYEKKGLIDIQAVYDTFGDYIKSVWENDEVQKYVKWVTSDSDSKDIYSGFEYIYRKVKSYKGQKSFVNQIINKS